jgi:hypothetical protein
VLVYAIFAKDVLASQFHGCNERSGTYRANQGFIRRVYEIECSQIHLTKAKFSSIEPLDIVVGEEE